MPTDKRQIKVYDTDEGYEAVKEAASNAGMSISEFIRHCFALGCAEYDVDYPDNMKPIGWALNARRDESEDAR
jgi:hypothetical protein